VGSPPDSCMLHAPARIHNRTYHQLIVRRSGHRAVWDGAVYHAKQTGHPRLHRFVISRRTEQGYCR
jgi:hypothetical protein